MSHHGRLGEQPERKLNGAPASEPALLRVCLLGGFRVSAGATVIEEPAWRLRKAKSLIKLLALAPRHRLHREQVQDLLWPEADPRMVGNNLHQALRHARRALRPASASSSSYLHLQDNQILLCPWGHLWTDVEAFEQAVVSARRTRDPAQYQAALDLYTGDLLPEDRYEEWTERRRAELHRLHLALLLELAGLHEGRGERKPAMEELRQALAVEPTCEDAHVGLMRLYMLSDQLGSAIRQYEQLRETLRREMDTEPSPVARRLYQEILEERMASDVPPIPPSEKAEVRLAISPRHNLPPHLTTLVGRDREIAEVKRLLTTTRLLTLTGTGGCGKTRLAIQAAGELVGEFVDGVRLVEMAEIMDPELLPWAVAQASGISEQIGSNPTDTLVKSLWGKELLLVLDNCEHLTDACAGLASALLRACSYLKIIATSREPLRVDGEVNYLVPSLSLPDVQDHLSVEQLLESEAARLFLERARLRRPSFQLTAENVEAVATICTRLGGIPLAIELAAARVNVLAVEQIATRLDDALRLLVTDSRTAPIRQQTVRAALDWSYELLGKEERRLLGRLSVFAGGWTVDAAGAVGAEPETETEDVLDILSMLVDKSLVLVEESRGEARYHLLETVRQYATERLDVSGEAQQARRRHAHFFLAFANEADEGLRGPDQAAWVERAECEYPNLRAALEWSLEAEPETALKLAGPLGHYWYAHGHIAEGRVWLEATIAQTAGVETAERARALQNTGILAEKCGLHDRATELYEEALALWRQMGSVSRVAGSLLNLGAGAYAAGDLLRAKAHTEEALARFREIDDSKGVELALNNLAEIAHAGGDLAGAEVLMEESLALARHGGDPRSIAVALLNLGVLAVERNDPEGAEPLLRGALETFRQVADMDSVLESLQALAGAAGGRGEPIRAATLLGAVGASRERLELPLDPLQVPVYERYIEASRRGLNSQVWSATWNAGHSMSADEAVEYALSVAPPSGKITGEQALREGRQELHGSLTCREREVARLVAQGLTNRRISLELALSERTVDTHVRNILKKLGVESRTGLAAWVAERRLSG